MNKRVLELYNREEYSMAEKMYEGYMQIVKSYYDKERIKYSDMEIPQDSEEFKRGFICGIKVLSSIVQDM